MPTLLDTILGQPVKRYRAFDDVPSLREAIFSEVMKSVTEKYPLSNEKYDLGVENVHFKDTRNFTLAEQKKAILEGRSLRHPLKGTWVLKRREDGQVVERKPTIIAHVPFLTNRGTFINNGSEYTVANQMRLRPGIYSRRKESGELESHFNIKKGTGPSFKLLMEPDTGIFRLNVGQSNLKLYPILKAMGVPDRDLEKWWGSELLQSNVKADDPRAVQRAFLKLTGARASLAVGDSSKMQQQFIDVFNKMEVDPETVQQTLGSKYRNVTPEVLMRAGQKLLNIAKDSEQTDDRDSLAFQKFLTPEDFFSERVRLDAGMQGRKLLWRSTLRNSLKHIPSGALTPQMQSVFTSSGMAQPIEQINPIEILDQHLRVLRLGEGGIPSVAAIPDESRAVQPTHLGFIDPVRGPESSRIGVDSRITYGAVKGSDGKIYTRMRVPSGGTRLVDAVTAANSIVAFPGEMEKEDRMVRAMVNGKDIDYVERETVDFAIPNPANMFTIGSNLVPMLSAVKGGRLLMGAKMASQALPLRNAETPLVQGLLPDGSGSFSESLGETVGALRADARGIVTQVDRNNIEVKLADGSRKQYELYDNFPFNRKTFIHNTPAVAVGDVIKPGQLLAKSNYTNDQGSLAIGTNLRVAYLNYKGLTTDDAIVISESAAKNKLASEHMYTRDLDKDDGMNIGKNPYISIYPGKFTKNQLSTIDNNGVVKPGTTVKKGDPLILGMKKGEPRSWGMIRSRKPIYSDKAQVWDHEADGVVTDVTEGKEGPKVAVKSYTPMQVGDKLCFDPETEILTKNGWKFVREVTLNDEVATLNPKTDELEYQNPTNIYDYDYEGKMYYLNTNQINMLVTPNHKLWVAKPNKDYKAVTAEKFYKSKGEWKFKKDCKWTGVDREYIEFNTYIRYTGRGNHIQRLKMDDWLEFLGYYLAEGRCCRTSSGGYQVQLSQFTSSTAWRKIDKLLQRIGYRFTYRGEGSNRFEINSKSLYTILKPLGDTYTKYVPRYVQELCSRQLNIILNAYLDGDGHRGASWEYSSSSYKLAEDIQIICLKVGWCVSLREVFRADKHQKNRHWRGRINRRQLRPGWKKNRIKQYKSVVEDMVDYFGKIYCVTVPNHVIYVKRREKSYWSHNSGRYG